jgi:hypothetical protein
LISARHRNESNPNRQFRTQQDPGIQKPKDSSNRIVEMVGCA